MFRKLGLFAAIVLAALAAAPPVSAQIDSGAHAHPRITQTINETNRVALQGNTHPAANLANDRGPVPNDFAMEHMLLQLKRSPEQEQALQQFIDELHTAGSPNFHHWLTAQEFGEKFGLAKPDLDTITAWLESHGFRVVVYPSGMLIDFSGTASQVRKAFLTDIHYLEVKGERHVANMNDPRIPTALAPVVAGIVSLHDFRPNAMHKMHQPGAQFTFPDAPGGINYAVVPADLANIYNLNSLFTAGISGQGQTIVLIEDTDVFSAADWSAFRSTFGLSSYAASFTQVHPPAPPSQPGNNCGAPGIVPPNDSEAILDAEWASASAPSAAIEMAACADTTTTFGGLIAIQNLINASSPPPSIMSISYGQCETVDGAAANASYNSAYQQAVAEGVSVFVAAGDSGAAGCDNGVAVATHGIAVNALASTPYNVAVGGTDFSDTFSNTNSVYWNSANTSTHGSAISYIPEIPWNDSCAGALLVQYEGYPAPYGPNSLCNDPLVGFTLQTTNAGGGGPSACATGTPSTNSVVSGTCQGWPKPSWQSVLGNPNDGVRDTPDVSLFAADGLWAHFYIFCWSDAANGGAACTGDPSGWSGAGGTSFASPIMAGIQALVNQKTGSRQGNPNPAYYQLAASEYGSSGNSSCNSTNGSNVASACVFYDVTQGDMAVNCAGNYNCFLASASSGVLSTSNNSYQPAYGTTTGWDFATGIGTVNAANLVNNWPSSTTQPSFLLSTSPSNVTILQGASGSTTVSINPLNGFSGSVTLTASGLPSGVSAAFGTNPAMASSVLTLSASGTAATGSFTVTIAGTSGSLTSTTTFSLTVNPQGNFTLSASPSSLTVVQGASGTSTITVNALNGFNSSVSLGASGLPTGVTASFNPTSTGGASTLTLTASSAATTGTATVTITGSAGSLTSSTSLSLTVNPLPNFTLSASPNSLTITQGASGSSTITVNPLNGFNGSVTLSASGLPSGVTPSFSPASATGTSTLTLAASGTATTGTVTVTVTGTSGTLAKTTTISLTVNVPPLPPPPAPWVDADVGATGVAGSAGYSNGVFTVKGAGAQIYGSADAFQFVYQPLTGDGNVIARLVSLSGTSSNASAGVMIRNSLDPGSANAKTADWPAYGGIFFDLRSVSGGSTSEPASISATLPYWIKVTRSGSAFYSYASPDGVNWKQMGTVQTIPMGATVYVGLAVTSGSTGALATGTFDNVSVNATPASLPNPWLDQDIGTVGVAGNASYNNGTFTVNGAGAQIYGTADAFHFVYQPLSGDGTIVARLVNLQGGGGSVSAGVMIRNTLNAGSENAKTADWRAYNAMYFDLRTTAGGNTAEPGNQSASAPYWIKLSRSGNNFSSYVSADGVNWTQLSASQSIAMNASVYVGLAVTSGSTTALATATFDNVSVSVPAPPTSGFTLSASPSSVPVTQGASGTSTISVTPQNGFSGNVTLSASGLPTGLTWSFSPNPATVSATTTSTLTLTANSTAATGPATVTITGTSGSATATTTVSLTVSAAPAPNFSLSASSSGLTVNQGASGTGTITVTPQNGFSSSVALSASGLPAGVTAAFNPGSTPTSSSPTTSILTFTASSTAATGNFTVTITGTSGSLTNTTTLLLTMNAVAPPNFNLSASPNNVSVVQAGSASSTVSVTPQNGFSGSVSLSASGLPSGVTASFSPSSTTSPANSSTLTLSASSTATTGTATVTITGSSGGITQTASMSLTVTATTPPSGLPAPWVDADVGATGVAGSTGYSNGVFTVKGAGTQIYGTADAFQFVYQPLTGDGNVIARLVSLSGTSSNASAGVMIRNSLDPGSANAKTADWPAYGGIFFDLRSVSGGSTSEPASISATLPYWIKVTRSGSAFYSYASADGVNWKQMGTVQTIPMGATVYVGLAVTSGSTGALATGTFDNVSVNATPASLPNPWLDQDIGTVGVAGNASYNNGTFTVNGAGAQIYGTADAFHFVYQPLSGDGTIVARLVNLQGGGGSVSAGVMIRNTLNAGSENAKTADWRAYNAMYFDVRTTAGGNTAEPGNQSASAPYWIKLSRSGNNFSSYVSADGVNWTQLSASQSIAMNASVYVGLAVTSGSTTALATATFDNVTLTKP